MSYLMDTHVLLWFFNGDRSLPDKVVSLIERKDGSLFVSHISLWEIAIKMSTGKLTLDISLEQLVQNILLSGFRLLPVSLEEILSVRNLTFHHRDPFDRMLVAHAMRHGYTLVTKDPFIPLYPVNTVWQ